MRGSLIFETTRKRKDGSLLDVDVSKRVVKDENGQPLYIAVNKKDVTELTRLREERAMEVGFRGLLEAAPDAMVIVGKDPMGANLELHGKHKDGRSSPRRSASRQCRARRECSSRQRSATSAIASERRTSFADSWRRLPTRW